MLIDRRLIQHFDWPLFLTTALIPLLGLIVLYSAGFDPDAQEIRLSYLPLSIQSPAFLKQMAYLGFGLIALLLTLSVSNRALSRIAYPLFGITLVLLVAVLGLGTVVNGSRRWLEFGGMRLQPAEPMKIALILAMARYISRYPPRPGGYGFAQLVTPFLLFGIPMGLVIRQPDLGTALVIGSTGFAMVLFAGIRWRALVTMAVVLGIALVPLWHSLYPYQQRRVLALFNPDADPLGSGYHIIQSKIAVGSGGMAGKGFMRGTQTQLEFLPEHSTDFIFSVLGEEWGFLGSATVLLVYCAVIILMVRSVARTNDMFLALVTFGVAFMWFFHVVVNSGMVVGVLPVVGITLPLFSYGGSSAISFCISLGLILGIRMRRFAFVGEGG